MGENIGILVGRAFFSFCALLSLFAILKPEATVNFTIRYYKWSLKFLGFETEIKATERAKVICRIWSLLMLCLFAILIIILPKTVR